MVNGIIEIVKEIKTILILISFKRYFFASHPEKSILNFSLP